MIRKSGLTVIVLLFALELFSQPFLVRDQTVQVYYNNELYSLAWVGGLNNPQFSSIDFNEDDIQDLFIFDKSGDVIIPMVRVEDGVGLDFIFEDKYIKKFPKLSDWALLRDFNCDGYQDIFTYSVFGAGAMVYQNKGQVGDDWFLKSDTLLKAFYDFGSSSFETNIFISRIDIPGIIDYDNDGDLDIFTFQMDGFQLEFYKNFSVENGLGCDFDFELKHRCWGYFGELEDSVLLGKDCFNIVDPEGLKVNKAGKHTGSTILMIDLNGDDNLEVVMGDIGFDRLTSLINGGPSNVTGLDSIVEVDYNFPDTANPGGLNTFPASFYVDVNNDNIKDLIVAPNAQFVSDNESSVKLYLNQGVDNNPIFELETSSFLQSEMIDVGEGAYPILEDVNQDGLLDLLVGNRKKTVDGISSSSIHLYLNVGSAKVPIFEHNTDDYFSISERNIGEGLYPSFMDFNGDNALDLFLGNIDGNIFYILNSANAGQPFDFSGNAIGLNNANGIPIDVGQLAKPHAIDLNYDNLEDFVIGNRGGTLVYYENTGTQSEAKFTWRTDSLGGVKAEGNLVNTGNAAPYFFVENGDLRLIVGSEKGELRYYKSIFNNLQGDFVEYTGPASNIDEGVRTAVSLKDVTSDGLSDLIVGNYRGGLSFFKGVEENPDGGDDSDKVIIYPNPASDELTIEVYNSDDFEVTIFDSLGRKLYFNDINNLNKVKIDVSKFAAGNYIVDVKYGNDSFAYHLIIIKK